VCSQLDLTPPQCGAVHTLIRAHRAELRTLACRGSELCRGLQTALQATEHSVEDPVARVHLGEMVRQVEALQDSVANTMQALEEALATVLLPSQLCVAMALGAGRADVCRDAGTCKTPRARGADSDTMVCCSEVVQAVHRWEEFSQGAVHVPDHQVSLIVHEMGTLHRIQRHSGVSIQAAAVLCADLLEAGATEKQLEDAWARLLHEGDEATAAIDAARDRISAALTPTQRAVAVFVRGSDEDDGVVREENGITLGLLEEVSLASLAPATLSNMLWDSAKSTVEGHRQRMTPCTGATGMGADKMRHTEIHAALSQVNASELQRQEVMARVLHHEGVIAMRRRCLAGQLAELETQMWIQFKATPR